MSKIKNTTFGKVSIYYTGSKIILKLITKLVQIVENDESVTTKEVVSLLAKLAMNEDASWTILNKCKDSISLMGIPSFKTDKQKITPISFKHTDYIIEDIDGSNLKCRTYFVKILELNENLATNMKVTFVSDTLREKDDEQKKSPKVIIFIKDRLLIVYQRRSYYR